MNLILKGEVERYAKTGNGTEQTARLTSIGSIATASTEPPYAEIARGASGFYGGTQLAANAIAPDTALPTTTAKLALFNGEADGGRAYFIDHLHFFLASGTAAAGATLWIAVSNGKLATAVTANATGYSSQSRSGRGTTQAKWGTAVTLPASTVWFAAGSTQQAAAANFGQGDGAFELKGGILVPPGYALAFAVLSGSGTSPLYAISGAWAELETDLES